MAGRNGHEKDPELVEDLDAFLPEPVCAIKYDGKSYAVPHWRDVPLGQGLEFLKIWNEEATTNDAVVDREWRRLKILVPELPDEARAKIHMNALERILTATTRTAGPPAAGEAASASASPSPSTAASTPATASAT
jgi:hypothetical protein